MGYGQEVSRRSLQAKTVGGQSTAPGTTSCAQLDHYEEKEREHGMYGTVEADLKVQRRIKRAELTAFYCLLRRTIGPKTAHADSKRIIVGLSRLSAMARKRRMPNCGCGSGNRCTEIERSAVLEVEHV